MMETADSLKLSLKVGDNSPPPSTMSIDKLLPALLECFGIILCGYIAGRTNIITHTQSKGLGNFVSKFALPALLFKNMVLLDFGDVIWPFLWSILVAKVCVFFIVCVLTLIVASPDSRFSKAGLFSIFATQSNDFALGYPIVEALYQSTYPEYLQYVYLVAPVSLMLLNPIGFAFCEFQKWKNQGSHQQSKLRIVGFVLLQVLKNPIVFMVVFGISAHFVLHGTIPAFMAEFVDGLANSFGGAALFYLGLSMVGQLRKLTRSTVVTLILLITAKLLLMPLLCKDMVDLLDNNNTSSMNHSSLSDYAFLYGVFPTAPSVAIYAIYYNTELEVVTSGMLSTCIGMILWNFVVKEDNFISQIFTFALLSTSLYSAFIWPGLIALSIVLMKKYDDLNGSPGLFVIAGWGIPCLVTAVLLLTGEKMPDTINPAFFYGRLQIIFTTVVVGLSILLGGGSLVCLSRGSWAQDGQDQNDTSSLDATRNQVDAANPSQVEPENSSTDRACLTCECSRATPMPDMIISTNINQMPNILAGRCESGCESTDCLLAQVEELQPPPDRQVARHVLLCLLLTVFLLANFSSCLWLICNYTPGRLHLELQFFSAIAIYGQGFISFALFGLDKHFILLPLKRLYHRCFGKKKEEQPQTDLPDDIKMTCTQFTKYHKQQCFHDIVKKRRCGMKTMADCFLGCELVDWLQQVGLAQDRGEALLYGTRLQQGGVLLHIKQEYSFEDSQLHYYFTI
uniref:G protein-coupled receptor 155a n=1 Tax=Nothobranchius rachovii TaxID=451742 RepID=A0A1A8S5X1_9TELE